MLRSMKSLWNKSQKIEILLKNIEIIDEKTGILMNNNEILDETTGILMKK